MENHHNEGSPEHDVHPDKRNVSINEYAAVVDMKFAKYVYLEETRSALTLAYDKIRMNTTSDTYRSDSKPSKLSTLSSNTSP